MTLELHFITRHQQANIQRSVKETNYFSLPIFSFNKPFILTSEQEILSSGFDQKILGTSSNGQDIVIFYSGNPGIYFGDLNLDGSVFENPLFDTRRHLPVTIFMANVCRKLTK